MTRIAALLAVVLAVAVNAAEQQKSAKMVLPAETNQYRVAENELQETYKATLDTISNLYRELGMDEQMNEASSYRSQPDKARVTLNLALRRLAGEVVSVDEINEAYSNSYRLNVAQLVSGTNLENALELTSQLKDVKEQVGTAVTALKEMKNSAVGLGKNAFAMARLLPDSVQKVKTLTYKGHKLYKTAMAEKGIRPLLARLASMSKKTGDKPAAAATPASATPGMADAAPVVQEALAVTGGTTVGPASVAQSTPTSVNETAAAVPAAPKQ